LKLRNIARLLKRKILPDSCCSKYARLSDVSSPVGSRHEAVKKSCNAPAGLFSSKEMGAFSMDQDTTFTRRDAMKGAAALALGFTAPASAEAQSPAPSASLPSEKAVTGIVFESRSGGRRQAGDRGVADVLVSNGREVARTDADGRYTLPIDDEAVIFVIKPSGYMVPIDPATKLPQFSYVHQPNGSPANLRLRFRGVRPTGPLPDSVDFALMRQDEASRFDVILLTDPQPESEAELDFVRDDVVMGLIGNKAAFGITTGDILFDDLSLYGRHNRIMGQIGLPWWNIGGNHDLNFEATDRTYSRETFKRVFGAPYYAFNYGNTLFLMLDNVDYLGFDPNLPYRGGKYVGRIGERQLAFIGNVLKETPRDKLVVVTMHIPLRTYLDPKDPAVYTAERGQLLQLLNGRKSVSFAGHTHTTEHHYFGEEEGSAAPHHHHVLTAVSGSWWSGPFDYRGIAVAMSRDGSPNGFHILSIDGTSYQTRLVPAKEPQARRIRIMLDGVYHGAERELQRDFRMGQMLASPIPAEHVYATEVVVNVFDGGPRTLVDMQVGDRTPVRMVQDRRPDPLARELFMRNEATKKPWVKAEPSSHIWVARLPEDLNAGTHTLSVRVRDEYGRDYQDHAIIEVVGA
jgi:hypothetical protein